MIDWQITKNETGYDEKYFNKNLKSHKKVYKFCDRCNEGSWVEFRDSYKLCKSCSLKDRKLPKTHKQNIHKGINKKNNEKFNSAMRDYYHKTGKHQAMGDNKQHPQYLGIIVAEQVLSKIFKNVEIMPYGNPGYDFICNKEFKVDSKASIKRKQGNWTFLIKQNQISDYFLLLAFDNRTDLNPLYLWLIPGNVINDKQLISISESKLNKWDEYKLNINKVIKCCDEIKSNRNS